MRAAKFFGIALVVFLLSVSVASSKPPKDPPAQPETVSYYGYAKLDDGKAIISDGGGQYVDVHLVRGKEKYGDKIQVQLYNNESKDIKFFRCFMGKPELPWRPPRRVWFNFDIEDGEAVFAEIDKTVAEMLIYNVQGFGSSRRGIDQGDGSWHLKDNTVHLTVAKGFYEFIDSEWVLVDDSRILFLVDETCVAIDPNAITRTKLKELDQDAPDYWTSVEASQGSPDKDAHDHIIFMLYDNQLNFVPTDWNKKGVPITWKVTPGSGPAELCVRLNNSDPFYGYREGWKKLWTFNSGLDFSLIVSKNPLDSKAPPEFNNSVTSAWGKIKSE